MNEIQKLQKLGKGVICEYWPSRSQWRVSNHDKESKMLDGWTYEDEYLMAEHPDLEAAIASFLDMAGGK